MRLLCLLPVKLALLAAIGACASQVPNPPAASSSLQVETRPATQPPATELSEHAEPAPLSAEERAQLQAARQATGAFGLEFSHCHEGLVESHWLRRQAGRDPPPKEEVLVRAEPLYEKEHAEHQIAEKYAELLFSIWRDLWAQDLRGAELDRAEVRRLLAQQERVDGRLRHYLAVASTEGRAKWARYRYELALQELRMGNALLARASAEVVPPSVPSEDWKNLTVVLAMTYLTAPLDDTTLLRVEEILRPVVARNDPSPHALVARCLTAEVHAALGQRARALREFEKLTQPQVHYSVRKAAERRLEELSTQPHSDAQSH